MDGYWRQRPRALVRPRTEIELRQRTGFSGLQPNSPPNPHRLGSAVDAASVPVLDSSESHRSLVDLSAAARRIDDDSVRSTCRGYLYSEHDGSALPVSQPRSVQIRLNTRLPVSLQSGCHDCCSGISIDREVHGGIRGLQSRELQIYPRSKYRWIHYRHRLSRFADTGSNENRDQNRRGFNG